MERILEDLKEMEEQFKQMVSRVERANSFPREEAAQEVIERLATRVTAKGQELMNHAFVLKEESRYRLSRIKNESFLLMAACLLFAVVFIGGTSLLLSRRILQRLSSLQDGTEIVAGGDLGYKVLVETKDEIGSLASAFNKMSDELKSSYAELKSEIEGRKRAEEDLQKAQEHLEWRVRERTTELSQRNAQMAAILDATQESIWMFSSDGVILLGNHTALGRMGRQPQDILGKRISEVLPPDLARSRQEHLRQVVQSARPRSFEDERAGFQYHHSFYPVLDEAGHVTSVVSFTVDITTRKRAEEALRESESRAKVAQALQAERQRLFDVLETLPAMICLLTPDYHVPFSNRSFREKFGESQGRRCYEYCFGRSDPCEFCQTFKILETGQPHHWEVKGPDGSIIEAHDYPFTDHDGSPMILEMDIDITEFRNTQEALKEANEGLEQRVRERTAALQKSEQRYRSLAAELEVRVQQRTDELGRKNKELQEFAFVASHDLSEPLRKIQTFGDILKAKSEARLTEQERDYVSRMTGAARRMQELLDALLRYSRVETQASDLVAVNLDDIVRIVTTDLEVSIEKTGAKVEIGSLPSIEGDPFQWRQVFQNLIANAIKYHRLEVRPHIRISCEKDDRRCRIFVEDNGIGFDEQYLGKIFQPFQRLHRRNEYPGTGIGLSICRKVVERHGGTITAKSTPGKGSTFIITLPTESESPRIRLTSKYG